jgi:predicted esterase
MATTTHGRYLVRPPASGPSTHAVVGFHGYAQSAADMLVELEQIPGAADWLLVAVQGLHRFYDRRNDRVVASWMTREDRELAIVDNVQYVDNVVSALQASDGVETLVYLGFSQGTAMAFRAAALGRHSCRAVLALGGDVPPDVRDAPGITLPPVLIGRGAADEWYAADRFADDVEWLGSKGILRASVEFDGGHEFGQTFRLAAGAVLASLR